MKDESSGKENNKDKMSNDLTTLLKIPSRLVIKDIPSSLSDEAIKDIFLKNFKNEIKENLIVVKLGKKYSLKKRNKICFITVDNFEIRQKIIEFIMTFELVDPNGVKQKLKINDCLFQKNYQIVEDPLNGTIENMEHFKKFKEYFEKDKILDYKNEEENYNNELFENVEWIEEKTSSAKQEEKEAIKDNNQTPVKKEKEKDKKKKMIIIKNEGGYNGQKEAENKISQISEFDDKKKEVEGIEILEDTRNYNNTNNYSSYNKKNYYNNKGNNNYNGYNNNYGKKSYHKSSNNEEYNDYNSYKDYGNNNRNYKKNSYNSGYNDYNEYDDYNNKGYKKNNYYKGYK